MVGNLAMGSSLLCIYGKIHGITERKSCYSQ